MVATPPPSVPKPERGKSDRFEDASQIELHRRLLDIAGPGPATAFQDACRLMVLDPPFENTTHLLAHLLREMESALRRICLAPIQTKAEKAKSEKSADSERKAQIQKILTAYGWSKDDAIGKFWLSLTKRERRLHSKVHRNSLGSPKPFDEEFDRMLTAAIKKSKEQSSYIWNFASGNHFVIYGEVKDSKALPDGKYVTMHSSASEFKSQHNGLYPTTGNWYADNIESIEDGQTGRYIRYVQGRTAERFAQIAELLETFNKIRHRYFAEIIFGAGNIEKEVSNEQHYGMPTADSVAIGCQWSRENMLLLLTAPEKPIFLVKPIAGQENDVQVGGSKLLLYPHGLGKRSSQLLEMAFSPDALRMNGKTFEPDSSIKDDKSFQLRNFELSEATGDSVPQIITDILQKCPAEILGKLHQIFSYHSKAPLPIQS